MAALRGGSGAISGSVVTLATGQPIADATVTIYSPVFPDNRISVRADAQGRFAFTDLPAGRYTVGAVKDTFVNVTYGERISGRGGRAIPLADGEHREITFQLPHTSVIAGTVLDERGNPAVGASVRVFRYRMSLGYKSAFGVGSATTDATGAYRTQPVQPGDYAVCVSTQATAPLNEAQRLLAEIDRQRRLVEFVLGPEGIAAQQQIAPRLASLEAQLQPQVDPVFGYAPICHAGSSSLPSLVRVRPDEDQSGVNLRFPSLTRLIRIDGVVTGMTGPGVELDPILLINAEETRLDSVETARPNLERRFRFTNVPPGRYRIFVRGTLVGSPDVRVGARLDVVAADDDIHNIVLDVQPGAIVAGQVVFRGARPQPTASMLRQARFEVRLDAAAPGRLADLYPGPSMSTPDATGHFVISNVLPGEYVISASSRQGMRWVVDTATVPGRDVMHQPLQVKANQRITGVTVTMTDQRSEVTGTILTEAGEPAPQYLIFVYPAEERYWTAQSHRMFSARASQNGAFTMWGLPTGNYRVATLLDAEFGAWFDPAYVRRIDGAAIPLSVGNNEKKILNLRVPNE